jgi:hypothetical protein
MACGYSQLMRVYPEEQWFPNFLKEDLRAKGSRVLGKLRQLRAITDVNSPMNLKALDMFLAFTDKVESGVATLEQQKGHVSESSCESGRSSSNEKESVTDEDNDSEACGGGPEEAPKRGERPTEEEPAKEAETNAQAIVLLQDEGAAKPKPKTQGEQAPTETPMKKGPSGSGALAAQLARKGSSRSMTPTPTPTALPTAGASAPVAVTALDDDEAESGVKGVKPVGHWLRVLQCADILGGRSCERDIRFARACVDRERKKGADVEAGVGQTRFA